MEKFIKVKMSQCCHLKPTFINYNHPRMKEKLN